MSVVIYLPRAHPTGYDNRVPATQIVRWYWVMDSGCCRVELNNGSVLTSLRPEQIEAKYNEAMKGHQL